MKKLFILLTIFLLNCTNTEDKHSKEAGKFYQAFMLIDLYHWVNICPTNINSLAPGEYTISLKKGEAYYFDIEASRRNSTEEDYLAGFNFYVGISNHIPVSEIAMNEISSYYCQTNQILSNPKQPIVASDTSKPIEKTDVFYNYYKYHFYKKTRNYVFLTIKSTSNDLNFQLKIPEKGEIAN